MDLSPKLFLQLLSNPTLSVLISDEGNNIKTIRYNLAGKYSSMLQIIWSDLE